MDSSFLRGSNRHFHWQIEDGRATDNSTYIRPVGCRLSSEETSASLTESTGLSSRSA